ncbi:MAG: hypothetical protein LBB75_09600, partial [Oscillospiraceae bacterium]|nr:hypothetical protein [Oscillospiraceae bacterium]
MNATKRVLGILLALAMGLGLALPAVAAADATVIVKEPQSVTIRPGEGFVLEMQLESELSSNQTCIWYHQRGGNPWTPYQAAQTVNTPTSSSLVCQAVVDPYLTSVNDDQLFPAPTTLFSSVTMDFYCEVQEYRPGSIHNTVLARSETASVTVKPGFTDYFIRLGHSPIFFLPQSIFISFVTGPFALVLMF